MDKYKRLVSNTLLTAVNQFSSRLLTLLMTMYYTRMMLPELYGTIIAVQTLGQFFIPLVLLGMRDALVRFGLEDGSNKTKVYTNGLLAFAIGYTALLALWPLLYHIPFVKGTVEQYSVLMMVFLFTSCLNTVNCQFTRARGLLRLYAVDGILNSALTLGFTVLFISGLGLKPEGILLAVICGDAASALFLFFIQRLWRFINLRRIDWRMFKTMLRFALPLISASIFWSITNTSDVLFVKNMVGDEANGIMSACYKIPTLLTIVATLFTEAWQISAYTDGTKGGREHFFSRVYSIYQSVMFMSAAGIVWLCRWLMSIFVAKEYYIGWMFIPMFTFATVFSSLGNFVNSIYMVEKKSGLSLATMSVGAVLNLVLNALFIPQFGVQGAAAATAISYMAVFLVRALNTRRLLPMDLAWGKTALNCVILSAETIIQVLSLPYCDLWTTGLTALMLAVNFRSLWATAMQLLKRGKRT